MRTPKQLHIFSQKKAYILENVNPEKCLIPQETELYYDPWNGNPKKPFIFQKVAFQDQKTFLRTSYILGGKLKSQKIKNFYTFPYEDEKFSKLK